MDTYRYMGVVLPLLEGMLRRVLPVFGPPGKDEHPRNIIFGGGGFRGISFFAALCELIKDDEAEWRRFLSGIRVTAGVSVGSIAATAMCCTPHLSSFREFMHRRCTTCSFGTIFASNTTSILSDDGLTRLIEDFMNCMHLRPDTTFEELFDKSGKMLKIYVGNLTKQRLETWSHETHPNMRVAFAIRVSCSACPVFPRVEYDGSLYMDGGVFSAYPGIGDPLYAPEESLFIYIEEKRDLQDAWLSHLSLLSSSYTNGQRLILNRRFPAWRRRQILIRSSLSQWSLVKGSVTSAQLRNAELEGRLAVRNFRSRPTK